MQKTSAGENLQRHLLHTHCTNCRSYKYHCAWNWIVVNEIYYIKLHSEAQSSAGRAKFILKVSINCEIVLHGFSLFKFKKLYFMDTVLNSSLIPLPSLNIAFVSNCSQLLSFSMNTRSRCYMSRSKTQPSPESTLK